MTVSPLPGLMHKKHLQESALVSPDWLSLGAQKAHVWSQEEPSVSPGPDRASGLYTLTWRWALTPLLARRVQLPLLQHEILLAQTMGPPPRLSFSWGLDNLSRCF